MDGAVIGPEKYSEVVRPLGEKKSEHRHALTGEAGRHHRWNLQLKGSTGAADYGQAMQQGGCLPRLGEGRGSANPLTHTAGYYFLVCCHSSSRKLINTVHVLTPQLER